MWAEKIFYFLKENKAEEKIAFLSYPLCTPVVCYRLTRLRFQSFLLVSLLCLYIFVFFSLYFFAISRFLPIHRSLYTHNRITFIFLCVLCISDFSGALFSILSPIICKRIYFSVCLTIHLWTLNIHFQHKCTITVLQRHNHHQFSENIEKRIGVGRKRHIHILTWVFSFYFLRWWRRMNKESRKKIKIVYLLNSTRITYIEKV